MAAAHDSPLRALMIAQIHTVLAELAPRQEWVKDIATEAAADQFFEVYLSVVPRRQPAPTLFDPRSVPLKALERSILQACEREALTVKRLAGRLSRKCNTYFQGVVHGLWKRDLLEKTPLGFRTSRPG